MGGVAESMMGSRSGDKRATMKYDNNHRTQMSQLRQRQSSAQRQKKQRPPELSAQSLQEAVHKGRRARLPGHPGLHNRLHKENARQGLRRSRRRRDTRNKRAEGSQNACRREIRAETEAQALRLPGGGRVLDVRGEKKEPEMADLRISQGKRGDSRVRVGQARPEDGEASQAPARGARGELRHDSARRLGQLHPRVCGCRDVMRQAAHAGDRGQQLPPAL